jgi:hypothetical protein
MPSLIFQDVKLEYSAKSIRLMEWKMYLTDVANTTDAKNGQYLVYLAAHVIIASNTKMT